MRVAYGAGPGEVTAVAEEEDGDGRRRGNLSLPLSFFPPLCVMFMHAAAEAARRGVLSVISISRVRGSLCVKSPDGC